jgi:hypothetical protein
MSTKRRKGADSQMLPVMVLLHATQRGGQQTMVSFLGPTLGPMSFLFLVDPLCLSNTGWDALQFAYRFDRT